jgi:hypothetical protein
MLKLEYPKMMMKKNHQENIRSIRAYFSGVNPFKSEPSGSGSVGWSPLEAGGTSACSGETLNLLKDRSRNLRHLGRVPTEPRPLILLFFLGRTVSGEQLIYGGDRSGIVDYWSYGETAGNAGVGHPVDHDTGFEHWNVHEHVRYRKSKRRARFGRTCWTIATMGRPRPTPRSTSQRA